MSTELSTLTAPSIDNKLVIAYGTGHTGATTSDIARRLKKRRNLFQQESVLTDGFLLLGTLSDRTGRASPMRRLLVAKLKHGEVSVPPRNKIGGLYTVTTVLHVMRTSWREEITRSA